MNRFPTMGHKTGLAAAAPALPARPTTFTEGRVPANLPNNVSCRPVPAACGETRAPVLLRLLAVGWLIGGFLLVALAAAICTFNLHRPWGAAGAALLAALLLLPLRTPPPDWARRFLELSIAEMRAWFPISVAFEHEAAFDGSAGPFVIGGCSPLGLCGWPAPCMDPRLAPGSRAELVAAKTASGAVVTV